MTPNDFVYWLQGFFEISEAANVKELNEAQAQIVKDHLQLVFKKETPIYTTCSGTCGVAGNSSEIAGEVSSNSTC
jgi:DUF438 domain-containing protein